MEPGPAANWKLQNLERLKGYRYPAPGSQPAPVIPRVNKPEDVFDINLKERTVITATKHLTANDIAAIEAGDQQEENRGSTGRFGNAAVKTYDPTGLRSAMTATHEAMEASLEAHQPTQLVHYAWEDTQDEIVADFEAKGIPVPPGMPFKWKVPDVSKQARW